VPQAKSVLLRVPPFCLVIPSGAVITDEPMRLTDHSKHGRYRSIAGFSPREKSHAEFSAAPGIAVVSLGNYSSCDGLKTLRAVSLLPLEKTPTLWSSPETTPLLRNEALTLRRA